jgi:hypothetical protein
MIVRVVKHLMVCDNKYLYGFTYGRIYKFIDDPDIYDTGYNWVKNDKGVIKAAPLSSFVTLDRYKHIIQNKKAAERTFKILKEVSKRQIQLVSKD